MGEARILPSRITHVVWNSAASTYVQPPEAVWNKKKEHGPWSKADLVAGWPCTSYLTWVGEKRIGIVPLIGALKNTFYSPLFVTFNIETIVREVMQNQIVLKVQNSNDVRCRCLKLVSTHFGQYTVDNGLPTPLIGKANPFSNYVYHVEARLRLANQYSLTCFLKYACHNFPARFCWTAWCFLSL